MTQSEIMKCSQCGQDVSGSDSYIQGEKIICEDCYLKNNFRVQACDPFAVRSAEKFQDASGNKAVKLTELQEDIYKIIKSKDRTTSSELLEQFHISNKELENQLAILRHCSLIKGQKDGRDVYFTSFENM
jgi:predicted HTH transcriptional regulator